MNILLGEDDKAIVDIVKIILEGEGYSVSEAKNETEVLKLAETSTPQLILLDIGLAGSDGAQVARKLKQKDSTKNIPLIMVSADSATETIAKKVGADGFLLKPFEVDDLIKTARQYLS